MAKQERSYCVKIPILELKNKLKILWQIYQEMSATDSKLASISIRTTKGPSHSGCRLESELMGDALRGLRVEECQLRMLCCFATRPTSTVQRCRYISAVSIQYLFKSLTICRHSRASSWWIHKVDPVILDSTVGSILNCKVNEEVSHQELLKANNPRRI